MDSKNNLSENSDAQSKTKIPSAPVAHCINKTRSLKTNSEHSQSKIPKRDSFNIPTSKDRQNQSRIQLKSPMTTKKPSASLMDLSFSKTNRPTSLASSRSNYTQSSMRSREQTPRSTISEIKTDKYKTAAERVTSTKNIRAFQLAKDKLKTYQENFMNKYEIVRNDLPKEEGEYKVVGLFKNNEGELVLGKQGQKIKIKCDLTLPGLKKEFQAFVQKTIRELESLDQFKKPIEEIGDSPNMDLDLSRQIEEVKKKLITQYESFSNDFLRQMDFEKTKDVSSCNAKIETKICNLQKDVENYKKALETSETDLVKFKKCHDDKSSSLQAELEKKSKNLEKKICEFGELQRKYELLEKESSNEKKTLREIQNKLNKKTSEWEELNSKLKTCAQTNVTQENINKSLQLSLDKVKAELNDILKEKNERRQIEDTIADQASKHANEVFVLKHEIAKLKNEKENLEVEVQNMTNELKMGKDGHVQFMSIQQDLEQTNMENKTLHETIRDLEEKLKKVQNQACVSRDNQEELSRLQRAENSNNEKVKKLEIDLTRAQFHIKKLEEKITMDAKLLKVRTNLIESLQKKEHTQKVRLEDLFVEVGGKNNDLQMIKSEILTKTEEFQNLFSTLGTKQLELTRQEHMIKLLQESNERAQNLRVKQESKIARLESEISELKQSISIYQEVVLPTNNKLRNSLVMTESSHDADFTDSLGFYVEERRKKRHIDINVKKYEK